MKIARILLAGVATLAAFSPVLRAADPVPTTGFASAQMTSMSPAQYNNWLTRWQSSIISDSANRYCDTAMGEDIGWLMQPFLNGYYYGYQLTKNPAWVGRLVDWTDSWVKRGVVEPDGYIGWPKLGAAGTDVDNLNSYYADSLLGEAMVLRPIVLMAKQIINTPSLNAVYGAKAQSYLLLAKNTYQKWNSRGAWRDTANNGAISVVLPFGIDTTTGQWTAGYATRNAPGNGFSHPDNKANETAMWLTAMSDVTGDTAYHDEAQKWYRLLKSRMTLQSDGTYAIWNYWQPAGAWDYIGGSTKHWVGVHPNAGYYEIDLTGIVDAFEHGLIFSQDDINHLIATGLADQRYWTALAPYSTGIQQQFEATFQPDSWSGHSLTPWYLALVGQAVPEPGTLTLLACGAVALLGRRRR